MSGGLNYGHGYNNLQYGWPTASPEYEYRNPRIAYDVPEPRHVHVAFDDNRAMFEEERPLASSYPERVVFEERHSVPVRKNHRHEPRKHVHFVEHEERVTESVDSNGNHKVYHESVDSEADGFINRKHKNFELNRFGTFNPNY